MSVTNMALNKLVFFAVEKVLIEKSALLTNAKIEAWDHGPVFREIYQAFRKSDKPIKTRIEFYSVETGRVEVATADVNDELSVILKEALSPLLPFSAPKLRNMSHVEGGPWHQVWCHDGYANPGMEITPELILRTASEMEEPNAVS
jgi:uncharacterized phage-associated protein